MIKATPLLSVAIPDDVRAFAAEQGVSAELPAVLEMTQRIFPKAALSVQVEDDPEIANDRHILIEANGVDLSVQEAVEATWEWDRGLFACCPAPLVCTFRVRLQGVR